MDTGVQEGLTVGHASVRDARLAVYIILLVKYRLDGAALEAGGGCKELQKVSLPLLAACSFCSPREMPRANGRPLSSRPAPPHTSQSRNSTIGGGLWVKGLGFLAMDGAYPAP